MTTHGCNAAARRGPGRLALVLALAAMSMLSCTSGSGGDNADELVLGADESRYVPEVDEGLGAAIAIVVDNSGSMDDVAAGDSRPKYEVAREALEAMIASTDSFVAKQPDFPIKVGLIQFSSEVRNLVPVGPYNRDSLLSALSAMPPPNGGTAIGSAMEAAREELYRAGTIRKYILVVTDGENTSGRSPRSVAREIFRRSEGAVRFYFVAFDIDAGKFDFLRDVRGEVMGANNGVALRASLDTIYQGRILAEAMDAGETLPAAKTDSGVGKRDTMGLSRTPDTSPKPRKP